MTGEEGGAVHLEGKIANIPSAVSEIERAAHTAAAVLRHRLLEKLEWLRMQPTAIGPAVALHPEDVRRLVDVVVAAKRSHRAPHEAILGILREADVSEAGIELPAGKAWALFRHLAKLPHAAGVGVVRELEDVDGQVKR